MLQTQEPQIAVNEKIDSTVNAVREARQGVIEAMQNGGDVRDSWQTLWDAISASSIDLGKRILAAIIVYIIGRFIIKWVDKLLVKRSQRSKLDPTVQSFTSSLVKVLLNVLLIVSIISTLGIETSSFAALFTAAGMAIGMALSGQLSNFAAGVLILLFRPFKVGDYIETSGQAGTVKEIQIFHTVMLTVDNKTIIIPNNSLTTSSLVNYSRQEIRRIDWVLTIDYGQDFDNAKKVVKDLLDSNELILKDPAYNIYLGEMADSSINITVRAWTKSENYWTNYFWFNEIAYKTFNEKGISFAYPHVVVSKE
ncbi:MAG: mechanosensitive ion channel [Paludibacteraceae bacterium]|nr:mechanosensitive ion channel [Paludibacteraceae bacterium]